MYRRQIKNSCTRCIFSLRYEDNTGEILCNHIPLPKDEDGNEVEEVDYDGICEHFKKR